MDYPAQITLSADDVILREAGYYIRFLAYHANANACADDDGDDETYLDDGDNQLISLQKLITFPRLCNACNDDLDKLR